MSRRNTKLVLPQGWEPVTTDGRWVRTPHGEIVMREPDPQPTKQPLSETPRSSRRQRLRANALINKRIKLGWFARPQQCPSCGKRRRIDGHHKNYRKPSEIEWMCRSCHMKWHRDLSASNATRTAVTTPVTGRTYGKHTAGHENRRDE